MRGKKGSQEQLVAGGSGPVQLCVGIWVRKGERQRRLNKESTPLHVYTAKVDPSTGLFLRRCHSFPLLSSRRQSFLFFTYGLR